MEQQVLAIAKKLWPELELEATSAPEQMGSVLDVLGVLYSAPLAVAWIGLQPRCHRPKSLSRHL